MLLTLIDYLRDLEEQLSTSLLGLCAESVL